MAGKKSDKTAKAAKTAAKPATAKRTVPKKTASASKAETSGKTSRAKAAGKTLIIVESPTKARTLSRVLGAGYLVKASVGHVKDLPPSRLGIDVDHDFALEFEVHPDKKKVLSEIRSEAKSAREVYLASDPDREGEAIAYHIAMELEALPRPPKRVLFHELTEGGIRTALSEPGEIDVRKVEAQKARRALDRIVGYTISPLLWDRVRRGLSAGRVQSVAVRLVCDREEAIARFVREEYWTIDARFRPEDVRVPPTFLSRLDRVSGEKPSFPDGDSAGQAVERIRQERFTVGEITRSDKKRNPSPPLTTSRLQQEAANRLRFSAKKTMTLAQRLYEGVDLPGHGPVGLITYMRTDSVRVSPEAAEAARRWIRENHPDALPSRVPAYKNRKGIQDAHEAIRPADVARTPESLRASIDPDLFRLYDLIWKSFMESQMAPALYLQTTVLVEGDRGDVFRASGRVLKSPGFLALRGLSSDMAAPGEEGSAGEGEDRLLPPLETGEVVTLEEVTPDQHFTEPPPRYSEASLIRELEEKGIGRPSTYATILSTIQDREYVEKKETRFYPTDLGKAVNSLLVESFPDLMSVRFTARMEEELDQVEEGERGYRDVVGDFYTPFHHEVEKAKKGGMANLKKLEIPTEVPCPVCQSPMNRKWGKNGPYLSCSRYPECRTTRNFTEEDGQIRIVEEALPEGEVCQACQAPMVVKKGRFGTFLACSRYPECKTTRPWPPKPEAALTPVDPALAPVCPECSSAMVQKRGKFGSFWACSRYPDCKGTRPMATGLPCPVKDCKGELVPRRGKRGTFYGCSRYPECTYLLNGEPVKDPCPDCRFPYRVRVGKKSVELVCPNEACSHATTGG
ncbi:MAG: type I DNA topoisomerase [Nitrospirae bacterium]|nr:type I DNA topoisomerase [Nitrospirota bacterium]